MGLLGFFKKKPKEPQEVGCLSNITVWDVPKIKEVVTLAGEVDVNVYVYDAAPLASIDPAGFELDVAYCDGVLRSQYTGREMNTAGCGFVVATYGGAPVGSIAIRRDMVEYCASKGTALKVSAHCDGWLQIGSQQVRNVKAKVPRGWEA